MCGPMRKVLATAALALASAAGCSANVDYIDIDPDVAVFKHRSDRVWLRARAMSHTGTHYPQVTVSWSVKDPSVASVDQTGRLTPLKSGRTEVQAKIGKVTASVPVEVLFAEKLKVEPSSLSLSENGDPLELRVRVYDYLGRELRDRPAMFRSLDPSVLTMGQNAAFPEKAGKTQVEVRVDELVQQVDVQVNKK
jgi:hypothetical protein